MFSHIKNCLLNLIFIASTMEKRQLAFIFLGADLIECELVEVFEEPRAVEGVLVFAAKYLLFDQDPNFA